MKELKETQKRLMILFVCIVVFVLLTVFAFEMGVWQQGDLAGEAQTEFVFTFVMELVTLGCAFLSLRLFKFGKVKNDLVSRKALALKKWGIIRLFLLGAPLLLDTLLYYTYMKATFGYLALILVLCLPFVYPSMDRCLTETEEESETEVKSETEVEP